MLRLRFVLSATTFSHYNIITLIIPNAESRTRSGDTPYKIHDGVASPSGLFSADFLKL